MSFLKFYVIVVEPRQAQIKPFNTLNRVPYLYLYIK